MNEINTYRCDECGDPCILTVVYGAVAPKTCPYSEQLATKANFKELR